MIEKISMYDAEKYLLDLAQKAELVASSHIQGMTFDRDELVKLSVAIRIKLGESVAVTAP